VVEDVWPETRLVFDGIDIIIDIVDVAESGINFTKIVEGMINDFTTKNYYQLGEGFGNLIQSLLKAVGSSGDSDDLLAIKFREIAKKIDERKAVMRMRGKRNTTPDFITQVIENIR